MKEYIKPSVFKVRDENGTFVPIAAIRGEKGEPGGPLWIRYSASPDGTAFTVDWTKGQTYIGLSIDPKGPPTDKTRYNWVELPKGETGSVGLTGAKGDRGDSVRFAYAHEPYKREVINQNGTINAVYDSDFSTVWSEGMTWLGLYTGTAEPSEKTDYVWIQLPKGESGNGSVKIKYAKSVVDNIATEKKLRYLAAYYPVKGYFFEDNSLLSAKEFKNTDTESDKRYVLASYLYGYTLLTHKPVYMAQDTGVEDQTIFFVTRENDDFYRRVGTVIPEQGYFVDTGEFLSRPVSDAKPIHGVMTLQGNQSIYTYTHGVTQRYYRVATDYGVTKYPVVKRIVGATLKRTSKYYSLRDLADGKIERTTTVVNVSGMTNLDLWKYTATDVGGIDVVRYYHRDITKYNQGGYVGDKELIHMAQPTIAGFEYLEGDPDKEVYYIPTERMEDWVDSDGHKWRQTDMLTTTNEGPIYEKEAFTNNEEAQYAIISHKLESYEHMEYFNEYNPEADFMGLYTGTKMDVDTTDYQWIKIKGSNGRTGGPVFIRYAAAANDDSGIAIVERDSIDTVWHEGLNYIGIGVGEAGLADDYGDCNNSDSSIYNWIPLFKGIKGDKGDKGLDGKDGKPSALLFKYSPFPDGIDPSNGQPCMYDNRAGSIYIGICKDAYYDPVTNTAITKNDSPSNYLWLELPDSSVMAEYGSSLQSLHLRTHVDIKELDLDSGEMITRSRPIDTVVENLYETIENRVDTTDSLERSLEAFRVTSRKADNANVDKLNVTVGYMRQMLSRIRELEARHSISSSGAIELPYFDYSSVESLDTPTNTSFSAHVKLNSMNRYDIYYLSTMCTNDTSVWVKLKEGYDSILSSTEVYMYRVPLDPTEEVVRVPLSSTTYTSSNGYYWYLLLKSSEGNLLIQPMIPSVPENLYDYLMIERDQPTDA